MKAIILAAGRGSRLKQFTDDRPKCLNEVRGKALIDWQISALRSGGLNEIAIVTGYKSHMLEKYGLIKYHNAKWDTSNMVSSLLCAKELFNQTLIVSYSDIVFSDAAVTSLRAEPKDIVVAYDTNWKELWEERFENPLSDAESFIIDKNGYIQDIGRKVNSFSDIQGQYIGLMRFSAKALNWICELTSNSEHDIDKMDMTTLLRLLINAGYPVCGMAISGGWCEIDTPADLNIANKLSLNCFSDLN